MEPDPTCVCGLSVGLRDVEVLGVDDETGATLRVTSVGEFPIPLWRLGAGAAHGGDALQAQSPNRTARSRRRGSG